MPSDQKKELTNELLEFEELSDLELEPISGGNKAQRGYRRRRRAMKRRRVFRRIGRALGFFDGKVIKYKDEF